MKCGRICKPAHWSITISKRSRASAARPRRIRWVSMTCAGMWRRSAWPADVLGSDPGEPREPRFVLKGGSAKSRTDSEVIPSYEAKAIDVTHEFVGFRIVLPVPFAHYD